MSVLSIIIIWCDNSFDKKESYQPMQNEFNEATTTTPKRPLDGIDMAIFNDAKEELRLNDVPLITVQTTDDAIREIEKHKDKKIFVICSGTVGRYLVPKIVSQYPHVHDFYIYAHNITLHFDWADEYVKYVKMFSFHTNLLVRLTRDIANYFIKRGQMFLEVDAPQDALICFNHAQNLEIRANIRDKIPSNPNSRERTDLQPDFRDHLDLLEGKNGLICQAETAIRIQGLPLENS
jgi:hypothetical protein